MTSGVVGAPLGNPYYTGVGFYKQWSGTDGRKTSFNGKIVDKWNNYTCTIESRFAPSQEYGIRFWQYKTLPSDGSINIVNAVYQPGAGFASPNDFTATDDLALLAKLLDKVKKHGFNLAVNLGQLHQTVDLLETNLLKLGRAALALKKGDFASAARQLGARPRGTRLKTSDVSGRWLELQYGWLPLIGDSYEAAKAYEAITSGPRSQTYTCSIKRKYVKNGSQSPTNFSLLYDEENRKILRYQAVETLSAARQLGLYDPLSVAWELLPWSFVVDWFIPVGTYLDVLNQVPALRGRFLTTVVNKQTGFRDYGVRPFWDTGAYFDYHYMATTKVPRQTFKRIKVSRTSSVDPPSVPFPRPSFAGAVHGRRFWNAVSLAHQRFRL